MAAQTVAVAAEELGRGHRLLARRLDRHDILLPRRVAIPGFALAGVVLLATFVLAGGPHYVSHQYQRFLKGTTPASTTAPGANADPVGSSTTWVL